MKLRNAYLPTPFLIRCRGTRRFDIHLSCIPRRWRGNNVRCTAPQTLPRCMRRPSRGGQCHKALYGYAAADQLQTESRFASKAVHVYRKQAMAKHASSDANFRPTLARHSEADLRLRAAKLLASGKFIVDQLSDRMGVRLRWADGEAVVTERPIGNTHSS